jgi:hypothetical protein
VDFARYFKHAFTNRWNLLAFFGALGFGLISGAGDVVIPLLVAGELTYLGLLSAHPKFQKYVDAQRAKGLREAGNQNSRAALEQILKALPRESLMRFESLRTCCIELRQIASAIKDPAAPAAEPLDELQVNRLDRLLWMFLRLLYTEFSLRRFLKRTSPEDVDREIAQLQAQLVRLPTDGTDPQKAKVRQALEDNLATCRQRQSNMRKAADNLQLIQLELDRLENKIRALSEMTINRQEPQFIADQVNQVATSLIETEKTMNDLRFATGLEAIDDAVPELTRQPPLPPNKLRQQSRG